MANVSISNAGILTTGGSGDFDEYTINGLANSTSPAQKIYSNNTLQVANGLDEVTLYGGSAYFNGVNNYLTTTTLPSLNGGDFTLEAWVNPGTSVAEGPIFKAYSSGTNNYEIRLVNNVLSAYFNSAAAVIGGGTLANNTWYHVALVRSGNTLTQYLNGTANGSVAVTTNTTVSTAYIGRNQTSTFWNGSISNLRLTNNAIYTSSFNPQKYTLNLTANTILLLETLDANTFTTSSGANNKVIVTNPANTVFNKIGPFNTASSGSILFSGSANYLTAPFNSGYTFAASQDFTVEFWMNYQSHGNSGGIFSCEDSPGSSAGGWAIRWNGGANTLTVELNTLGVGTITSSIALVANTWNHIALVRSAGVITLYVNGTATGTPVSSSVALAATTATLKIAADRGISFYTAGYFTNMRIVKGTAVYTGNFTPPSNTLQAISGTTFLLQVANSANFITDSSTTAATLTNTGAALYKHYAPISTLNGVVQKLFSDGTLCVNGSFDEVTTSTPTVTPTVEYLVVAGGGSGGYYGGGGGGGGYRTGTGYAVTAGSPITVTVGAGGAITSAQGAQGSNSVFGTITSIGGGGGSDAFDDVDGTTGGSGGGGRADGASGLPGLAGTAGQGYAGGQGSKQGGGGGGGAGSVGGNAPSDNVGGNGGAGLTSYISGSGVGYAGGGGGGGYLTGNLGGTASFGGGAGGTGNNTVGSNATPNTGGGGGGGGGAGGVGAAGGAGGSGIVIIRYPNNYKAAASTTGSPTITDDGTYRVYKFTGTGSITF